jgi:hypothetical protein
MRHGTMLSDKRIFKAYEPKIRGAVKALTTDGSDKTPTMHKTVFH